MSQYSQTAGSFIRTSNYPLEADYIFATEEELKSFYSEPANKVLLHKGWFKVVEDDGEGNQALYWVDQNLEFKKLINITDIDSILAELTDLQDTLDQEIADRANADKAIWGTDEPETIDEELNSILDLSKAVKELKEKLILEDSIIRAIVGTKEEDMLEYLSTLPYNTITKISETLNKFFNTVDSTDSKINTFVELQNFLDGYEDTQNLKSILNTLKDSILGDPIPSAKFRTLRSIEDFIRSHNSEILHDIRNLHVEMDTMESGIGLNSDGSFSPDKQTNYLQDATSVMNALRTLDGIVKELSQRLNPEYVTSNTIKHEYKNNTLTSHVKIYPDENNQILIKENNGLYMNVSAGVDNGIFYIKVNGDIVGSHNLALETTIENAYYDTEEEKLVIKFKGVEPVEIDLADLFAEWEVSNGNSPIVLNLERVVNGKSKLSASVTLTNDENNILEIKNKGLLVKGTSDNIKHGDSTVEETLNQVVSDLKDEIDSSLERTQELETSIANLSVKTNELVGEVRESLEQHSEEADTKISDLTRALDTETNNRISKDNVLENIINSEKEFRISGDANLKLLIDSLDSKISTLQQLITTNSQNIANIDNRLLLVQQQIEAITQLQRSHGWYEE